MWPSVRREIRAVMGLVFLLEADLGALYSSEVCCGDSSSFAYALLVTSASGREIREAWQ